MEKQNLLEKTFEEFPEEKTKYQNMNLIEKTFYNAGLHILNFRKYMWKNIIPKDPLI